MEFSSQSQVAKVLSAGMLPSHAHACEFSPIPRMGQIRNVVGSPDNYYPREGLAWS